MSGTNTIAQTNSYSTAKAKYVMDKAFEDFTVLTVRGFASDEAVKKWKEDLLYIMNEQVLLHFEIQLTKPNGQQPAIEYVVKSDFSISEDAESGRLNLHSL